MFSLLEGLIQISQLGGPALGAFILSTKGVFSPVLFSIPLALASIPLLFLLPPGARTNKDLLQNMRGYDATASRTHGLPHPEETQRLLPEDLSHTSVDPTAPEYASWPRSSVQALKEMRSGFGDLFSLFKRFPIVRFSAAALLVVALGKQSLHVLLQYTSKRFGVSIAEVALR